MSINKTIFLREHPSDVFLEEHNHVYIHKKTKYIYPSVTTLLETIKEKLDADRIIPAMIKNYTSFKEWYFSLSSNDVLYISLLEKFLRYGNLRDYTWATWEGREYKKYKKIQQYKSIEELEYELDRVSEGKEDSILTHKVYLTNDCEIMDKGQIEEIWEIIKELANLYGTLIHQILENFLLVHQQIYEINEINRDKRCEFLVNRLNQQVINYSKKYKFCAHIFQKYKIQNFEEFNPMLIESFIEMGHDFKNYIYIPEKILYYEDYFLCGMSDMVLLDKLTFTKFEVGDHKTNINFSIENEYNKYLKPPFNHIEETDINLYNFQITIYSLMYQNMTKRTGKNFWISYFNTNKRKFEKLNLALYLEETKELLETYKTNFQKNLTLFKNSRIFDNVNETYHYYLTFKLSKDIEEKRQKGILSSNKEENRAFYNKFTQDIIHKIEPFI